MTDNIERVARTILWVVLSISIVAIPLMVLKSKTEVESIKEEMNEALKSANETIAKLSEKKDPDIFPVKEIETYLSWLNYHAAEGRMTFTNTTAKNGFLCLHGLVENTKSGATSESIPDCKEISPYESSVQLQFKFAGSELQAICPKESDCSFSVSTIDIPKTKPEKPISK